MLFGSLEFLFGLESSRELFSSCLALLFFFSCLSRTFFLPLAEVGGGRRARSKAETESAPDKVAPILVPVIVVLLSALSLPSTSLLTLLALPLGKWTGGKARTKSASYKLAPKTVFFFVIIRPGPFRTVIGGAIAQSGGPATQFFVGTSLGLYNATVFQSNYDKLVRNVSCGSSSTSTLDCLRNVPFEKLNAFINSTTSTLQPWPPQIDNDFIADYPTNQLKRGAFVKVPMIIGGNTDEGTAFGGGYGPNGTINTDSDFRSAINPTQPASAANNTGKTTASIIDTIAALYPNIQAIGIPSLETNPQIYTANNSQGGAQLRRMQAYGGDIVIHAPRRAACNAWSAYNTPVYSYRFDVLVYPLPPSVGATHFQEVAFVFDNVQGLGYASNPFNNTPPVYTDLAGTMSAAWVNFIAGGDPNGKGPGLDGGRVKWPVYNATSGGGAGMGIVWSTNRTSFAEWDTFRAEGIQWISDNALAVYGR